MTDIIVRFDRAFADNPDKPRIIMPTYEEEVCEQNRISIYDCPTPTDSCGYSPTWSPIEYPGMKYWH